MTETRTCRFCSAPFTPRKPNQLACSPEHGRRLHDLQKNAYAKQKRLGNRTMITCEWCGKAVEVIQPKTRFCCREHKQRARNRERAQERIAAIQAVTCRGCPAMFKPVRSSQSYCSESCRRQHRPPADPRALTCAQCGDAFVATSPNQTYCTSACRRRASQRRLATTRPLHRKSRAKVMPERSCAGCSTMFVPKGRGPRTYCSDRCRHAKLIEQRRAKEREKSRLARAGIRCCDCGVSIAEYPRSKRCTACATKKKNTTRYAPKTPLLSRPTSASPKPRGPKRESIGVRTSKIVTAKSKANLRPKAMPKLEAIKPRKHMDHELPNFAGDWFPGWNGCWSPSISEEERELIRKHLGLEDPDPQVLLAKHAKRKKDDAA